LKKVIKKMNLFERERRAKGVVFQDTLGTQGTFSDLFMSFSATVVMFTAEPAHPPTVLPYYSTNNIFLFF